MQNAKATITVELDTEFLVAIVERLYTVVDKDKLIEYFCSDKYASAMKIDAEYVVTELIDKEGVDEDTLFAMLTSGVLADE